MLTDVNELSIFVAAVISVAIGSIWYSPLLFASPWLKAARLTVEEENVSTREAFFLTVLGVLLQSAFFAALAYLFRLLEKTGVSFPFFLVIIGAMLLSFLSGITIWERKPLAYFLIHGGYTATALIAGLSVIIYWPW